MTRGGPFFDDGQVTLYCGDCRPMLGDFLPDAVVTDPPYGDTSLDWDRRVAGGWLDALLGPQLWCFGSMRFWLEQASLMAATDWTYAQEVVWEKHNGSGFHADRFRRVHELAVHWYRGAWGDLYHVPPVTNDATARTLRRNTRPTHTGHIENAAYASEDGGPKLMRSVQYVRGEHGRAVHPTQKPLGILRPLIEYSCPVDGLVFDPFAGSGSTLVAARDLGRRAIGIEISEAYCEAAVARLAQGALA